MTFYLFQYYLDPIFFIDNVIEKVECVVFYVYFFDFITFF